MGYDVHVTRNKYWIRSKFNPISFEEWKNLVLHDTSMNLESNVDVKLGSGSEIFYAYGDGIAVWTPKVGKSEQQPVYFIYKDGRIVTKNPDRIAMQKLKEIAEKLQAYVIGDEGEEY
ncbi:hypothetical protein [Brevibacillus parabrevis]|uniref:hypothetical protein n=1 Tax=Brevibacillus parabrevis TaxID=54914 RepID=UPI0028D7C33B|nr:hypothetical protein [Brevibacillus parabrevis]